MGLKFWKRSGISDHVKNIYIDAAVDQLPWKAVDHGELAGERVVRLSGSPPYDDTITNLIDAKLATPITSTYYEEGKLVKFLWAQDRDLVKAIKKKWPDKRLWRHAPPHENPSEVLKGTQRDDFLETIVKANLPWEQRNGCLVLPVKLNGTAHQILSDVMKQKRILLQLDLSKSTKTDSTESDLKLVLVDTELEEMLNIKNRFSANMATQVMATFDEAPKHPRTGK